MCEKFSIGELYILHELMKRNETQYNLHCKCSVPWNSELVMACCVYCFSYYWGEATGDL